MSFDRFLAANLAALYLRGAPRRTSPPAQRWPEAERALRSAGGGPAGGTVGWGEALRARGLWAEALALETPGLFAWALDLVEGNRAITAACPLYPERWLRLGASAPPALYARLGGSYPARPFFSIVGGRHPGLPVRAFARLAGAEANRLGYTVISGGAIGCDRAAILGAGADSVVILPCGFQRYRPGPESLILSLWPVETAFSPAAAMERNALIYAASGHTLVVDARFKQGGAWAGATHALRARLGRLIVRADPASLALRTLVALGGLPLSHPADLATVIAAEGAQPVLFGNTG